MRFLLWFLGHAFRIFAQLWWAPVLWLVGVLFLTVLHFTSCRAFIPGTVVREPPAEHEGYQLYACDPPSWSRTPSPPPPDQACCWYLAEVEVRFVCTKDGGSTWQLVQPNPLDPTFPDFLR